MTQEELDERESFLISKKSLKSLLDRHERIGRLEDRLQTHWPVRAEALVMGLNLGLTLGSVVSSWMLLGILIVTGALQFRSHAWAANKLKLPDDNSSG